MSKKIGISIFLLASAVQCAMAQTSLIGQQRNRTIITAVPFLTISPDARHAALGDAGVASTPDPNSAYWNPGKLAFIDKKVTAAVSYTPWLTNLNVNDVFLAHVTGTYKANKENAFGASLTYFSLGQVAFTDITGNRIQDFNPQEYAFAATYSRQLTDRLSIGGSAKFIHSNLAGSFSNSNNINSRPANSAAVDLGLYSGQEVALGGNPGFWSWGVAIQNFGPKISYTDNNTSDFLPMNLKLGTALTTELDAYNKFTFMLDFNKLLVPSPQLDNSQSDSTLFGGMFGSFNDAPDGFNEELKEINISAGVEYWYDNLLAVRGGYFHEDRTKGNRRYFTAGLGIRYQSFGLDVSYLIPVQAQNPLENTLRFTLLFNISGETPNQSTAPVEESVAD